jgi:hypothetical protein
MLRPAGHSLREQADELQADLMLYMTLSICIVTVAVTGLVDRPFGVVTVLFLLVIVGSLFAAALLKSRSIVKDLDRRRLGLDGELATAEELNQLMRHGYYVFHDFPATEKFNIDHIVIGPAGVFAVETKAHAKPNRKGKEAVKVLFDGTQLEYPGGYCDKKALSQAQSQAVWLAEFLRKSTGKPVYVNALVSLPGWLVERRDKGKGVLPINPKEAAKAIVKRKAVLDEATVRQIAFQVEQRCRDLKPFSPL